MRCPTMLFVSFFSITSTITAAILPVPAVEPHNATLVTRGPDINKRGIVYNNAHLVNAFRGIDSHVRWGWNWYSSPYGQNCANDFHGSAYPSMEGMIFTPNMWTHRDACLRDVWAKNVDNAIKDYRADAIIAFNEPEMAMGVGGSNMSPEDAVRPYIDLMHPFIGRIALGAPATTFLGEGATGGWSWLRTFLSLCTTSNPPCRVDFIPIHFFLTSWGDVGAAVALFQSELTWLHREFGRPIWITEMHYNARSESEEVWFLRAMLDFFELTPWLHRYSYRTAEEMTRADGALTTVGWCYVCFRSGGHGETCCLGI